MSPDLTRQECAREVARRLTTVYGEPSGLPHQDGLSELVCTILSQNTNDVNRDRAFAQLKAHFPTWESVRDAPLSAIVTAIRPAGLAATKGPHIQAALQRITQEQGKLSLEFLKTLPLEEARSWLTGLEGVGPKTAAIVLLFAFGRPAFPVDTHVHRVTLRLGLIPPGTSREAAHRLLENLFAPEAYYPVHINLITHGRQVCQARRPHCSVCILTEICNYYQEEYHESI